MRRVSEAVIEWRWCIEVIACATLFPFPHDPTKASLHRRCSLVDCGHSTGTGWRMNSLQHRKYIREEM
jgi:hypothetical protein